MNVRKLKKRKVMESKFQLKDDRTFTEKLKSFLQSLLFWRGREKGIIHTRTIEWDDFRYIFFPKGFEEKYGYLGTAIWEESSFFKYMYPLVLAMDYEAKPKWCPRWFLRFLHVFGDDKSVVRVRNRYLSDLHGKLTKGIQFWDWKTKWSDYDLRISISGPKHLQDLADAIESKVYQNGREEYLISEIKKLLPTASIITGNIERLEQQLEGLQKFYKSEEDTWYPNEAI
jgi:hypothetical protein